MDPTLLNLHQAEAKALQLFAEIEKRGLIKPHTTEEALNDSIFELAKELFGIEKYWHKRIVRAGENTLRPYHENPPNLTIQEDDILFLDFGPIFEDWEADIGRTYVLGNNPHKLKLKHDIEKTWYEVKDWFDQQTRVTGAELFAQAQRITQSYGWEYGGEMAGHLVGRFPHEKLEKGDVGLYIHPDNSNDMLLPDANGNKRHWILEMHFVDRSKNIGGFFEQLLTSS